MAFVVAALTVGIGARIAWLNNSGEYTNPVQTAYHEEGGWADLDGSFASTAASEKTAGYSVRVVSAKVVSYNDWIDRYGDASQKREGLDSPSVIDVEVEVRNEGNTDGGLFLLGWKLFPERRNMYYLYDIDLLKVNEPKLSDRNLGFAVAPGATRLVHIPYTINANDPEGMTEYRQNINDADFELVVTNSPVKHVMELHV